MLVCFHIIKNWVWPVILLIMLVNLWIPLCRTCPKPSTGFQHTFAAVRQSVGGRTVSRCKWSFLRDKHFLKTEDVSFPVEKVKSWNWHWTEGELCWSDSLSCGVVAFLIGPACVAQGILQAHLYITGMIPAMAGVAGENLAVLLQTSRAPDPLCKN